MHVSSSLRDIPRRFALTTLLSRSALFCLETLLSRTLSALHVRAPCTAATFVAHIGNVAALSLSICLLFHGGLTISHGVSLHFVFLYFSRSHKLFLALRALNLLQRIGPLLALPLFALTTHVFREKVLTAFEHLVNLALGRKRWKWSVLFVFLAGFYVRLGLDIALFELGQKAIPVFLCKLRIFCKLAFDHHCLDVVHWMNIRHALLDNPTDLLQPGKWSHCTDGVALDEHVAVREELDSFQR
mmetsp:Transcript_13772/g.36955  ORF Transcript_13772/g.36955 Transcript_13772/m.36955 type:complete len:243 (-) Transcript_13772:608-1336(-)